MDEPRPMFSFCELNSDDLRHFHLLFRSINTNLDLPLKKTNCIL